MDARDENKKLTCVYFAHPISHYNTQFEWECIEVILTMLTPIGVDLTESNIEIMNPNQKWLSQIYQNRKAEGHEEPFGIFNEVVRGCDVVVGCTFFDGSIGAGVAKEMSEAQAAEKDVFLIFIANGIRFFMPCVSMENYRVLTVEETRAKLRSEDSM